MRLDNASLPTSQHGLTVILETGTTPASTQPVMPTTALNYT